MKNLDSRKKDHPKNPSGSYFLKVLLFFGLYLFLAPNIIQGQSSEELVMKAYQLRINGKLYEGKSILDQVLLKDSTCALAWFELARTQQHLLLGGGKSSPAEILELITKAVKYDPDNAKYLFLQANSFYLKAYISDDSEEEPQKYIDKACKGFKDVFSLLPDNKEALLYLVDTYATLPENMGGNKEKANFYAQKLIELDKSNSAEAKAMLMPDSVDIVQYWNEIYNADPTAMAAEKLGIAYIYSEDITNATKYLEEAMKLDPSKNLLQLDIARVHVMMLMQQKGDKNENMALAKKSFQKFLDNNPNEINSYKAYTLGWIAKLENFSGNPEKSKELVAKAKELDAYFSPAFGVPSKSLFFPPDKVSYYFSSYFRPF
ncbi:MAG: hypothetical protein U9N53_00770 [Bacteroidota bacterium]|nr:hypothetical protein [Bacteroidota bacterium]